MYKKLGRAYKMVTGLALEITPEQRLVAQLTSDAYPERSMRFELDSK